MEHQGAAPGVEQGSQSKTDALLLPKRVQSVPRGMKECSISLFLMAEDDAVQFGWDCEYHVKVGSRKQFLPA